VVELPPISRLRHVQYRNVVGSGKRRHGALGRVARLGDQPRLVASTQTGSWARGRGSRWGSFRPLRCPTTVGVLDRSTRFRSPPRRENTVRTKRPEKVDMGGQHRSNLAPSNPKNLQLAGEKGVLRTFAVTPGQCLFQIYGSVVRSAQSGHQTVEMMLTATRRVPAAPRLRRLARANPSKSKTGEPPWSMRDPLQ
jgi:hypothetical protein